ncbi:uncharacterized protein PFLUO_LOCUS362 [Penicillium psychrofluorescens]|uniref:uncharacterized protein n=1 Tax=Penicillium psychrofluorescens TaxID=3158075 RepID=UPI003CCE3F91
MSTGGVTPAAIKDTGYVLIGFTSLVVAVRLAGSIRQVKDIKAEDFLILIAYALFLELAILYIIITPVIFRLAALESGLIPMYAGVEHDTLQIQIFFFVTTSSLWLCLWMVKFSLLSMYKRFLSGRAYITAWWLIFGFCILFLIGCILSSWFSCSSFHAWFTAGECDTARDHRASVISLYYSYAVDLVTDFAIMVLPLGLIWKLKMKRNRKLSISGLFCLGWVCIVIATIRVIQLRDNSSNGQPKPAWLALWGTIEASIAVLIGCCPGLYRIIKARLSPSVQSYHYGSYGFQRPSGNALPSYNSHIQGGKDIALSRFSVLRSHSSGAYELNSPSSSQENLASPKERSNIVLTSQVTVTVGKRDDYSVDNRK